MLQTLLANELVDEFWLWIFPVVLFQDGTIPAALELTNVATSSTGVQMLRYRNAGAVEHDSFALPDEQ